MSAQELDLKEKVSDSQTSDSAMDACLSMATNGESAHKIPKLMDIEASTPTPPLMRGIAPSLMTGYSAPAVPSNVPTPPPPTPAHPNNSSASSSVAMTTFDPTITLEHIRATQHKFIDDRDWHRYHTPRNLLLAMVGEVGELSELFQWRGEVGVLLPDWSKDDKTHLRHELADVFLYLLRLSEQCGVDLPAAVMEKIALNEKKYPAELVKGSSKKCSEYKGGTKLAPPQDVDATEKASSSKITSLIASGFVSHPDLE